MPVPNHPNPESVEQRRQSHLRRAETIGLITGLVDETSATVGEILGLTMADINVVERSVQLHDARTGRRRTVRVSQELASAFGRLMASYRDEGGMTQKIGQDALAGLASIDLARLFGLMATRATDTYMDIADREQAAPPETSVPSGTEVKDLGLDALASHVRRHPERASALGMAAWIQGETGARLAEIAAIRFGDIDLSGRKIRLRGSKNGGERSAGISAELAMALHHHFMDGCLQAAEKLEDGLPRLSSPALRRASVHGRCRFLSETIAQRLYRRRPSE